MLVWLRKTKSYLGWERPMVLWVHIIAVLVIAYVGLGLTLFFMQAAFLYRPLREVAYTPEDIGIEFENVTLETADGVKLSAWYVPAKDAEMTILFCHGNGGNMMHRLDSISLFNKLGLNCFIFDYRGYGQSEGKTTEEGTYIDAMTAYEWLTQTKKISSQEIIVFGRSLGGSIAAHVAERMKVCALVLESCFTSYVDMGKKFYPYMPVRWFARFKYDTIGNLKKVRSPVMIIHSRNDEMIPFEFGLELYDTAAEPKEFVEITGSHNDGFLVSDEIYIGAWKKWLKFLSEQKQQEAGQQGVN
jgi:fermentation-respiration switch protein FrsA (DUF1100 family)